MNKPRRGSGIDFAAIDQSEPVATAPAPARPRTGVGAISASLVLGRGLQDENESLKARLAEAEGREYLRKLDPARVRPSSWANRHEASYSASEFATLKEEIASAGGNTQPVTGDPDHDFEIAFGHRRRRACLELGLPVLAMIEELSDQQLFVDMERENRERQDLSPWEQGMHYRRALDAGLFPSARQLAAATGASQSNVVKALQLADLPKEVVAAFANPLALQYRYAALLGEALQKDPDGVRARAARIGSSGLALAPKQVLHELLQAPLVADARPLHGGDGKVAGSVARDARGAVTIKLTAGAISEAAQGKLEKFIAELLKS